METSQNAKYHRRRVRVISRKALKEASERHPVLERPLEVWRVNAKNADWKNLTEIRQTYPATDQVGDCFVFNLKGNEYRLIVWIRGKRIYVRHVLTHAEYSKENWKNECEPEK
jgi:mRNA interferase HigB